MLLPAMFVRNGSRESVELGSTDRPTSLPSNCSRLDVSNLSVKSVLEEFLRCRKM